MQIIWVQLLAWLDKMQWMRIFMMAVMLYTITGCALVNPPMPECHYQDRPCIHPNGTHGLCRVARWQHWPYVYWPHPCWRNCYWQPEYWRNRYFW